MAGKELDVLDDDGLPLCGALTADTLGKRYLGTGRLPLEWAQHQFTSTSEIEAQPIDGWDIPLEESRNI